MLAVYLLHQAPFHDSFLMPNPCKTTSPAWADNLFSFAHAAAEAIVIQQATATHLRNHWELRIKDDSRDIVVCRHGEPITVAHRELGWKQLEPMRVLGHWIAESGGGVRC